MRSTEKSESGMALIMALLALLLLTAIGLTLATSTSTEVQVAANYRWSLQALHNAEAGIEAAKAALHTTTAWTATVPPRATSWNARTDTPATPTISTLAGSKRNFEMGACDQEGNGMGYGVILGMGAAPLENQSTFRGYPLNGAFTVWARRPLVHVETNVTTGGETHDYGGPNADADMNYPADVLIVVSEGVAPRTDTAVGTRAVQVIEAALYGNPTEVDCPDPRSPQYGGGAGGANMNPCLPLGDSRTGDIDIIGGTDAQGRPTTRTARRASPAASPQP